MVNAEYVARVTLKPNCGLENVRAALIARRAARVSDVLQCYPAQVKSDPKTIDYLRDYGLFLAFGAQSPEQVLMAVKASFFVDSCELVESAEDIPVYDGSEGEATRAEEQSSLLPSFVDEHDRADERLSQLLDQMEVSSRNLRRLLDKEKRNRGLDEVAFSIARAVDGLRTSVARSRVEPFSQVAPALVAYAKQTSSRVGTQIDVDVEDEHVEVDCGVLAAIDEVLRRIIQTNLGEGIERPAERLAAGKPPRAKVILRVRYDGSDVVCILEHDGRPFDLTQVGKQAQERGLLAKPLEDYTDDELGRMAFMPRFASPVGVAGDARREGLAEIGTLLHRMNAHARVVNTAYGTTKISLRFPIPFIVLDLVVVHIQGAAYALPAQHVVRFELLEDQNHLRKDKDGSINYLDNEGESFPLINAEGSGSPLEIPQPQVVALLETGELRGALAIDVAQGFERASVSPLPNLLDCVTIHGAGCIGYALLTSGEPCPVLSARRLMLVRADGEVR